MIFWSSQSFLLIALWPSAHASCKDDQCDQTAWLQLHASELEQPDEAEPLKTLQELAACDKDDMGCVARMTACSLATKMSADWPLSYAAISEILGQLQDVCNGKPLKFASESSEQPHVPEDLNMSKVSLVGDTDECSDYRDCTTNVEQYEKDNPGVKYGMKTGKALAKGAVDALKEILKDAGMIALRGTIAFAFIGSFISAFFPSEGGLPENPCTYATQDWGRCVWEQVKPFVQEFVSDRLDEAFEELWKATIDGYQTRLWALNATAYKNSELYPNGTIKEMPNATRDEMHEDLKGVHNAMLGDIKLFMTGRAIKTTAGAYLSQFASLHVSVMTNLLGSLKYRTEGHRYVFQTVSGCYALRVYEFATAALKSRMFALEAREVDHGTQTCCWFDPIKPCINCSHQEGSFKDIWKLECGWKNSGYRTNCDPLRRMCMMWPTLWSKWASKLCYNTHYNEVQRQTVLFWQNWLAPIPFWLHNVVLMQQLEVRTGGLRDIEFDCSAM